ncbi:MAG: hypothetical protein IKY94_11240 [Lachnospiraceae bacterium]|nr:hypothetical protein [Lachnospiraceae bacterium]
MKVLSVIYDGMLDANNVLVEMTIGEYLDIGLKIFDKNQYQRKRVSRSSSIYSLLGEDLKKLCTIPTIVLALTDERHKDVLSPDMTSDEVQNVLNTQNLIILDGLQRTYTIRDSVKELGNALFDMVDKEKLINHKLRIEIYCGLSKTGILYRMLTLNTGQTPMSRRHEIEILYSSYIEKNIEGITFNRQASSDSAKGINVYDFDNAIEGFYSFLESDELPMDRLDILDVIRRLEKVTEDDYKKDLFELFIKLYNKFSHHIDNITNHWELDDENRKILKSIYAKDVASFFNKSQTISAFGAAVGDIMCDKTEWGLINMQNVIEELRFEQNPSETMLNLLYVLQEIRENAKKIGVAQRKYLKYFFYNLFFEGTDSYQSVEKSIINAKSQYSNETDIRSRQKSLFD